MNATPDFTSYPAPARAHPLIFPLLYLRLRFPSHVDADGLVAEFTAFETWAETPRTTARIIVANVWQFRVTDSTWRLGGAPQPTIEVIAAFDERATRRAVLHTELEGQTFTPAEFEPVWRDYCAAIGATMSGPATEPKE